MRKRNKLIEKIFVEWFVNKIGWTCKVVDDEGPDFRIEFQDKIVGLEVTNIYKDENVKGSSVKSVESFRNSWLSRVAKEYYEKSRFPIDVDVLTISGDLKGDSKALASELAERSNINVWESKEFEFKTSARCTLKIWLVRLPDILERYSRWAFLDNHVGLSRPFDKIAIQEKVRNKAVKLPQYKKKYNEIILLIVSDRTYQSGMFHVVTEEMSTPGFGFSSVYLALYPENYIRIG